jgi:hypothetical protein
LKIINSKFNKLKIYFKQVLLLVPIFFSNVSCRIKFIDISLFSRKWFKYVIINIFFFKKGFKHSAFTFAHEADIVHSPAGLVSVPPGHLVGFIQKGLHFLEIETHIAPVFYFIYFIL